MKNNKAGFALLDVLLAVILLAVASYGSYMLISRYFNKAEVAVVENLVDQVNQGFQPLLDPAISSDTPIIQDSSISTSFLNGLDIKPSYIHSPGSQYSFLNSGLSVNGKQSLMNFDSFKDTPTDPNMPVKWHLGVSFMATCKQLAQIVTDKNNTYAIFASPGHSSFGGATLQNSLPSCQSDNSEYSVFMVYPITGNKPADQGGFAPPSIS